jgi:hypothetical protein
VPNVYALTANPVTRNVLQLAQEGEKTKGARAVFGVVLMFLILCGGVWMLLQSSFGPKQAYLVSSVAFWGSWLVLSLIWLVGVPGGPFGIPRSTPKYYGPQGAEAHWVAVAESEETRKKLEEFTKEGSRGTFSTIDATVPSQSIQQDRAAAESAAQEVVPEEYAVELGVGAADIIVPTVVKITKTELGIEDGEVRFARVTFGPAEPNPTDTESTKALIERIEPKTVDMYLDPGSLAVPTYISIALFLVLFLAHAGALAKYELNRIPQPKGAPERVPAGV